MNLKDQDEKRCKNYAFRLLKYRNRSEKEIRDRLILRKYPQPTIEEVVKYLKHLGLIDDRKFAREWTEFRLKMPFGIKRITLELRQKGINEDILKETVEQVAESHFERDVLFKLAHRRIQVIRKREKDRLKIRQKLYYYLLRRGFSASDIMEVLEEIIS